MNFHYTSPVDYVEQVEGALLFIYTGEHAFTYAWGMKLEQDGELLVLPVTLDGDIARVHLEAEPFYAGWQLEDYIVFQNGYKLAEQKHHDRWLYGTIESVDNQLNQKELIHVRD